MFTDFLQLVCTTEECLAVWSLLSLTVTYIVRNNPVCLAADPFSSRMVVVTRDNDGMLFIYNKTFLKCIFFSNASAIVDGTIMNSRCDATNKFVNFSKFVSISIFINI